MVCKVATVAFQGIEAQEVIVEVQMSSGLPAFNIVGLADKAVTESRERIRASFHYLGLSLPPKRITVNLAPADISKEGSHYDLPVALGIMAAMELIDSQEIRNYTALGELGLDGSLASVIGVLPAAINASKYNRSLICPKDTAQEAVWASKNLRILAAPNLLSLLNHFKGIQLLTSPTLPPINSNKIFDTNMADIKGQEVAKRALEIAAAGGHNILLLGPPGTGKSMLAQRLTTILPPLEAEEALEVIMIHSLAGLLPPEGLITTRPFRDPHHSSSLVSLIGGGYRTKPGEISLAHNGVLFLDELPEFNRATLESLRQPLETGRIVVARANNHIAYPAKIQLVAAMNPCRCGYFGNISKQCHRVPNCAQDYQSKISGPLLDRFDLTVQVSEIRPSELVDYKKGENSVDILLRVKKIRELQKKGLRSLILNSI